MMIFKIILCLFVFQAHLNAQNIVISENNFENKLIVVNMNSFTTNKNTETTNSTTVSEVLNNQNDTTEKALNESNVALATKNSSNSITPNNQYASKPLDVSKNIVLEYSILCNNRWATNDMD